MKRNSLLFIATMISISMMAGGIVTNTNQSAMYTRMQSRDAVLDIDAVYYNPAGLVFLPNKGLYFSINNQTVGQTRTINSDYQYLNNPEYEGIVSAPFFPGIYAAYKTDKFAFSFGFNPIGGGGGGVYDTGLPSFEYTISDLVPYLQSKKQDASGYRLNANLEGTSAFLGYQANVSYKINDMISVALGGRYVSAKETYKGYLKDIELNMGGTWLPASDVLDNLSAMGTGAATMASGAATAIQPLIDNNLGGLTFDEAVAAGAIDAATQAQLEGGLTALGIDPTGMTLAQAQGAYSAASVSLTETAATASATSDLLEDQEVDCEKTASGFTPIISVDIKPSDKLNISLKYEFATKLEFTNHTTKDFTMGYEDDGTPITKFPDGAKTNLDLPAQLVVGAAFKPIEKLLLSTGFHYYWDKSANWDGRQDSIESNTFEFSLGAEYRITEKLKASAGWLTIKSGITEGYQSDLSFHMPSNSFGAGFAYDINPKFQLNLGGQYTIYKEGVKNFEHGFAGSEMMLPVKETYLKPLWVVAIGLNINLGAGKE